MLLLTGPMIGIGMATNFLICSKGHNLTLPNAILTHNISKGGQLCRMCQRLRQQRPSNKYKRIKRVLRARINSKIQKIEELERILSND